MVSTADSYHFGPGRRADGRVDTLALRCAPRCGRSASNSPRTSWPACAPTSTPTKSEPRPLRRAPGARDRYVVAHGALREILAALTATTPAALTFDRRCRHCGDPAHGKPELADAPELSFSLSHSASVALVAVAREARVGVDVEVIRARRHLEKLAARVLTPDEFRAWRVRPACFPHDCLPAQLDRQGGVPQSDRCRARASAADGAGLARRLERAAARGGSRRRCVDRRRRRALEAPPVVATWDPERGITLGAAW